MNGYPRASSAALASFPPALRQRGRYFAAVAFHQRRAEVWGLQSHAFGIKRAAQHRRAAEIAAAIAGAAQ